MASKRTVLALLTKNELQSIVAEYDLAVADKRVKDQLLDAVASSKKATLDNLLPGLSRDRLKEICRALGLDDTGKEKAMLIDRITGKDSSPQTARPPRSKIAPKPPEGGEGGPVVEHAGRISSSRTQKFEKNRLPKSAAARWWGIMRRNMICRNEQK